MDQIIFLVLKWVDLMFSNQFFSTFSFDLVLFSDQKRACDFPRCFIFKPFITEFWGASGWNLHFVKFVGKGTGFIQTGEC